MPKMDGIDFLERLMRLRPTPTIMISSLTESGADITFKALELGAVDFISKPKLGIEQGMLDYAHDITEKIRAAANSKPKSRNASSANPSTGLHSSSLVTIGSSTEKLIIVGASTGGTEAIKDFLVELPPDCPGIVITQHMPEKFTKSFADRLDSLCRISVKEAEHGDRILPGHAYIAPGHSHLLVKRSGANYVCELSDSPPFNRHRPSVDILFRSAAAHVGKNAIGVILTGMGKDGAAGMREMKDSGAYNFAQNEESCVVFGMPKEAILAGGVDEVVSLSEMARKVMSNISSLGMRAIRV